METQAPHVYTAIAEVMKALSEQGIGKDQRNQKQGYKFRGIDDIYNALSGEFVKAHLCIMPKTLSHHVTERVSKEGGALFSVVVHMSFTFVSAKDASSHVVEMYGEAMDSGDKATNKAMSAAYKYACLQTFCIPTEGDNDADATTHETKAQSPAQPRNTATQQQTVAQRRIGEEKIKSAKAEHVSIGGQAVPPVLVPVFAAMRTAKGLTEAQDHIYSKACELMGDPEGLNLWKSITAEHGLDKVGAHPIQKWQLALLQVWNESHKSDSAE